MHRLFFLVLLLIAPGAYADYTWQLQANGEYYSAAQAACDAAVPIAQEAATNGTIIKGQPQQAGVLVRDVCVFEFKRNDGMMFYGQGFNCGGVPCYIHRTACEAGKSVSWSILRPDLDGLGTIEYVCREGCRVPLGTSECQPVSEGATTGICHGVATLDGSACNSGDYSSGEDTAPEPEPAPCEANPQAEGCTDPTDPTDPGGGDNGGGDNGGGDNGGGDNGGGDNGGRDNGGGDNGGGDGDGGDGDGGASGLGCDETLACYGDSVQCSILNVQKMQRCEGIANTDLDEQRDGINDFLSAEAFQPEEDEEIDIGEMFSEGTRFLPSACPSPESISLNTNGGRTFQLSYEPLCQFASDLSYLIVAAAAVFFALYVGRASGGE